MEAVDDPVNDSLLSDVDELKKQSNSDPDFGKWAKLNLIGSLSVFRKTLTLNIGDSRFVDDTTASDYTIHRYRLRIEGLLARIERWTKKINGNVHWCPISTEVNL